MSSIIKILRLQSCLNKRQAGNLKGLNGFLNRCHRPSSSKINIPIQIASASHTRNYAVQHVQRTLDQANPKGLSRGKTLETELQYADSLLRRGSYLKKRTLEQLVKLLIDSDNVTPSQLLFLLRCCGSSSTLENKETRNNLSSKIWNAYQEKGLQLDISHYNALLQLFVENQNEFSPLDFLATLEEKTIEPNRFTFSRLIHRYCQMGDIDGANKILEFMKEKEMELNEYIFNALILGKSRANDLEGAVGVVDIMKKSGLEPGPDTYAMLVQIHAEHNKVEEMEKLLQEYEKDEYFNSQAVFSIIDVLAEKNLTSIAERMFNNVMKRERNSGAAVLKPTSYRLIHAGQDELAFKMFKNLPFNPDARYQGSFFCHQIAMADLDLHKVVNYCEEIRSKGWNILAYENALETYLYDQNFEKAMELIRVMKEKNIELKEHYFYPFLKNIGLENDREKVFTLMEEIIRLQVPLSSEFFSSFLLHTMNCTDDVNDIKNIYTRLTNYQKDVDRVVVYNGIVEYLMRNFGLETASQFVGLQRHGLYWNLAPLLADMFVTSKNVKATATLLHQMLPLTVRLHREFHVDEVDNLYGGFRNFFRIVIRELTKENRLDVHFLPILKGLIDEGFYLVPSIIKYVSDLLGESMTSEIQEALEKLSDLSYFMSLPVTESSFFTSNASGISLRRKIEETELSGEVDGQLYLVLAITLIRQRNVEELNQALEKIKSNGITLSANIKVLLMDMYLELKMFKEAEDVFNSITDEHQDYKISAQKLVKVARMLVDIGRYDDAIKCLLMNSPEDAIWSSESKPRFDNNIWYRNKITNMLLDVCHKSDLATLKRLQETLISRDFAPPSWVLPSLIHFHVKEGNLEEAMDTFVKIAEEHNVTVAKSDLTVALIHKEDTDNIQKIMDISNSIHGDTNTLYDLVFAFIDAGKLKQAEKVMMTSGLRALQDKLNRQCEFYLKFNKITHLEGLVTVCRNLFNVDKLTLNQYLLQGYISENNPEKALELWNRLQEDGVDPDSHFLLTLSDFLMARGFEVPFVVPSKSAINTERSREDVRQQVEDRSRPRRQFGDRNQGINEQLQRALNEKDYLTAENLFKRGSNFPSSLISKMIALRLRNGKLDEAMEETNHLITRNELPTSNVLETLLQQLEAKGETAAMEHLGTYMNEKMKRDCAFNSRVTSSYVIAGRTKELINKNNKLLSEVSDLEELKEGVISAMAYRLAWEKNPELHPQLLNLAEQFKEKGNLTLYCVLYGHNFINNNMEEAEKIYEAHMKDTNRLYVRSICSHCTRQNDTEKLEELIQVIERKPEGREQVKGFIYSSYIDILSKNGKIDEALKVTEHSLKSIKLEHYKRGSLMNLKRKMEQRKLSFPYEIPTLDQRELSSSSSSSDDEKK